MVTPQRRGTPHPPHLTQGGCNWEEKRTKRRQGEKRRWTRGPRRDTWRRVTTHEEGAAACSSLLTLYQRLVRTHLKQMWVRGIWGGWWWQPWSWSFPSRLIWSLLPLSYESLPEGTLDVWQLLGLSDPAGDQLCLVRYLPTRGWVTLGAWFGNCFNYILCLFFPLLHTNCINVPSHCRS